MAVVGTVCRSRPASVTSVAGLSFSANLTAMVHELGHQLGARHDQACDGTNLMCWYVQEAANRFSEQALTAMLPKITRSGSCFSEEIPGSMPVYLEPHNFSAIGIPLQQPLYRSLTWHPPYDWFRVTGYRVYSSTTGPAQCIGSPLLTTAPSAEELSAEFGSVGSNPNIHYSLQALGEQGLAGPCISIRAQ